MSWRGLRRRPYSHSCRSAASTSTSATSTGGGPRGWRPPPRELSHRAARPAPPEPRNEVPYRLRLVAASRPGSGSLPAGLSLPGASGGVGGDRGRPDLRSRRSGYRRSPPDWGNATDPDDPLRPAAGIHRSTEQPGRRRFPAPARLREHPHLLQRAGPASQPSVPDDSPNALRPPSLQKHPPDPRGRLTSR